MYMKQVNKKTEARWQDRMEVDEKWKCIENVYRILQNNWPQYRKGRGTSGRTKHVIKL